MGVEALARMTSVHGETILSATRDTDEVVDACTGALRPHTLRVREPGARLSARLSHAPLLDVSVNRLQYGADVTVSPAIPEEDNFLLTLPVAGHADFRYGQSTAPATADGGTMVGPYREFEFAIDATFDQVVVRLDRKRVESVASAMTGETGPVHFALPLSSEVRKLSGALETAFELASPAMRVRRPGLLWQWEQVFIEALLLKQPNSRILDKPAPETGARSVRVRRAADFMLAHLADPLSIATVAAECGVSVRSLQESFRRELDTTPGQWLKSQRLQRAHALLTAGADGLSVTDVAYACGFFHLGEFGAAFKAIYGVTPSSVHASRR